MEVGAPTVSKVIDTTGAGDAFLGGLIIGIKANGMPETVQELRYRDSDYMWGELLSEHGT